MPIEQVAPELTAIVSLDAEILQLGDGFGGDMGPAEGPLWWHESGHLVFSDIHNNRRMKWTPGARSDGSIYFTDHPTGYQGARRARRWT